MGVEYDKRGGGEISCYYSKTLAWEFLFKNGYKLFIFP